MKELPCSCRPHQTSIALSALGLVLKPNPESDSEDSEPDGPDEPVIPSPEMDDVKGEVFFFFLNYRYYVIQHPVI